MSEDRLDRIEKIVEANAKAVEANAKAIEAMATESKQRTDSNAKAIEALTNALQEERRRRRKEDDRLNRAMVMLTEAMAHMNSKINNIESAQASFWQVQADYYRRLEEMDERQDTALEILEQLKVILDRVSRKD